MSDENLSSSQRSEGTPMQPETIGFIGLGNMGRPMAANLVNAGLRVLGFDLSAASCGASGEEGVEIASSARATLEGAEAVITMLPAGAHVLSVWADLLPEVR